jgi:hypothetical protein
MTAKAQFTDGKCVLGGIISNNGKQRTPGKQNDI